MIAAWIVRRRRWVALAWLVVSLAVVPRAARLEERLAMGAGADQSESARVERLLANEFGSPFAHPAMLVITGMASLAEAAGRESLGEIVAAIARTPGVTGTLSYLDAPDPAWTGAHGTIVVAGLDPTSANPDDAIVAVREATRALLPGLRARHTAIALEWTGAAALNVDIRAMTARDAGNAERRVLPLVLLLLLLVFGGPVAALLPVAMGALAIGLSLGGAALLAEVWPLNVLLRSIVSMLGLGLGIDYALLTVNRFREALTAGDEPEAAARATLRHAGQTVLLSGAAVTVGFAAMLLVPATELRSIATGGVLVVIVSALLATTLLPVLLVWIAPHLDWGALYRRSARARATERWRGWALRITAQPIRALALGTLLLAALAWQARDAATDIPSGPWLPERLESVRAAAALGAMGKSGEIQAIRVVVQLPEAAPLATANGWGAVWRLSRELERDARIARVRSLPILIDSDRPDLMKLMLVPERVRMTFASRDGGMALIELVPHEQATPVELMRFVDELRGRDVGAASGLPGVRVLLGGQPAANADYRAAIGGTFPTVVAAVVGGTFLVLLVGFRSVLVPVKALALNLVTVAAALGVAVLVFQHGYGARLLGLRAPVDGLFPAVPVIVFCIVFGLSMDYELFLVSRVAEGVRSGLSDRAAIVDGVAHTGGIITSAALVMIVVFGSSALGDFLVIKILGLTLSVAVLLDVTVVRMLVGPALLQLAGRWNWWPGMRGGRGTSG